jgi:hypothetical protein
MATYYTSRNQPHGTDNDGLEWDLQSNSRFGAKIKAESVSAQVEMGLKGDVSTRRIYAKWNFGAGKLVVGKDYTPIDQFISGQVFDGDLGLLGIGTQYGSRKAQIGLEFGNFDISFSELEGGRLDGMNSGETRNWIPRIDASWGMAFDTWDFAIQGGYNFYSIKDAVGTDENGDDTNEKDVDVTSYTIGATTGFNFGPMYIKAAGSYGENWKNAGWLSGDIAEAQWKVGTGQTEDTTSYQGALVGGFKLSDMLTFEAGVGARHNSPDMKGSRSNDIYSFYGQAVIALAPGVYVIPEAGYFSLGEDEDNNKNGNAFYIGGKWQIDF